MDDADPSGGFDITSETTVKLGQAFTCKKDQFKGGTLYIKQADKTYNIISNTESLTTSTQATLTLSAGINSTNRFRRIEW